MIQVKVIPQFGMWIQQQENDSCQGFVLAAACYQCCLSNCLFFSCRSHGIFYIAITYDIQRSYIRCNKHPLALHCLVVSLLFWVIHFHLNYLFILHIWQACILCFILFQYLFKRYSDLFQYSPNSIYLFFFLIIANTVWTAKVFCLSIKELKYGNIRF